MYSDLRSYLHQVTNNKMRNFKNLFILLLLYSLSSLEVFPQGVIKTNVEDYSKTDNFKKEPKQLNANKTLCRLPKILFVAEVKNFRA